MGSSQPPDGNPPFGYNFSDEDLLYLKPPSPQGDPILDLNAAGFLGSFFDTMASNQYPLSYGEGLNFSDQWISELAPNFLGHSTSFGPQPPPDLASTAITGMPPATFQDVFTFGQNMMPPPQMPPPPPPPQPQPHPTLQHLHQPLQQQISPNTPIEQNAHADIAAVLTTLHSGHQNAYPLRTSSLNRTSVPQPQNTRPPINHARSFSQSHPIPDSNAPIRPARSNEPDTLFTDMMFGSHGPSPQRPAEPTELQWGSDATFARGQGFVPPEHESSEVLEKKRMNMMKALRINNSIPNTRASSPIGNEDAPPNGVRDSINGHVKEEEEAVTPPRKRRKSKAKVEIEEDIDELVSIPPKTAARKRKSKGSLNGSSESASVVQDTPGKRRKSALSASGSGAKPPRENLSDAQKRENHIKSEQKRRGAIKEGFDDLTHIVPNLKGGGYSKSTVLNLAGEWLEALIKGNEEMSRSH
ncbi:hypothetical protein F5Y19DRAFT_461557 [Xylariaceae sp. FL1651]|nr:hypothetical protein F5Y19DRAFT_461557 [Xylariaceae sp. FL1651]